MVKYLYSALMFVCLMAAAPAWAQTLLQAPEKAGRESAFMAVAASSEPVKQFQFSWNGKTYAITPRQEGNQWIGKILLPVPATGKSAQKLMVTGDGRFAAEKNIQIYEVKRPVQKLTVDRKYVEPPREVQERIQKDREKVKNALAQTLPESFWEMPFYRPVSGGVTSQFGLSRVFNGQPRGKHRGLDLRAPQGTPIRACADGIVALVDDLYYSGNTVYLNHGDGVFSAYLHMSDTKVQPGQRVSRGEVVGLAGATGRVTGPHLHLSVIVQGQSVDPLPLLEPVNQKK